MAISFTCFIELMQPAISLVIFGAGNDAIPLMQIAAALGWMIDIVDGRANYAIPEKFPWPPGSSYQSPKIFYNI